MNLEKNEVGPCINEQKKAKNKSSLTLSDEINIVSTVIKKHVDNIKNNIEVYFKYQRGYYKHRDPFSMRYFDIQYTRNLET